jgi:hypothetical protein
MAKTWRGLLAPIGKPTGDGRMFAAGALSSRDLPMPLRFQRADVQGHSGAVVVGRILKIDFTDDGIWGEGDFMDPEVTPEVTEAQTLLTNKVIGPSVDLDDAEMERVALSTEDAEELAKAGEDCGCGSGVNHDDAGPSLALVTKGRVSAATLVQIPAFAEAHGLELSDEEVEVLTASIWTDGKLIFKTGDAVLVEAAEQGEEDVDAYLVNADEEKASVVYEDGSFAVIDSWRLAAPRVQEKKAWEEALVAAATRVSPPDEWFSDPELSGPTPLTVDADGRVFGHLADWSSCHIGFTNECVQAPPSGTDYAYFHTGSVETASGELLPVGRITLGTGHAGLSAGAFAAAEHYDNTGTCVAVVRAGEDQYGIWVAGSVVPEATAERVAELRRSPLSGDWREVGGNLELVAALAVNTPGFGIPRTRTRVASGRPVSLVAAGSLSTQAREKAADKGYALPDGSYPIRSVDELEKAIQAYGRAKDKEAAKAHIMKRARALDRMDLIPEQWRKNPDSYAGLADEIGKAISAEFARRKKREQEFVYAQQQFALVDADRFEEAATLLAVIGGE